MKFWDIEIVHANGKCVALTAVPNSQLWHCEHGDCWFKDGSGNRYEVCAGSVKESKKSACGKTVFVAESFSDTISMAESLGWLDLYTDEEWSAEAADACEDEAIEFIESKGFKVLLPGECE